MYVAIATSAGMLINLSHYSKIIWDKNDFHVLCYYKNGIIRNKSIIIDLKKNTLTKIIEILQLIIVYFNVYSNQNSTKTKEQVWRDLERNIIKFIYKSSDD